jgi:hypothetical protein
MEIVSGEEGDGEDDEEDDEEDDDDGDDPIVTENLIAAHNSTSPQYDRRCTDCHGDIHTEESLNPSIPTAHVAMFSFAPGEPGDDKQCVWCHRSVDLVQGSTGNLRRSVDARLCTLCHGPLGPAEQFYQTGVSPTEPDGEVLYELTCASCHGDLGNSEVRGESSEEIQEKIEENEGGMGPLSVLTPEEIQAIADGLAE